MLASLRYPNTYTFTKALGEILLARNCHGVPTAVVRPTIVGAAWQEPVPGWVDTVSAGGAMYLSGGLGFMPVQPGNEKMIGDQIPVDLVVNTIIAAAARTALDTEARGRAGEMTIYHSSTSTTNPVAWSQTAAAVVKYWRQCPSAKNQVYTRFRMVSNPVMYRLLHLFHVSLPATALGMYARVAGNPQIQKKAQMMNKILSRTRLLADTFYHFTNNEWFFDCSNTERLEALMCEADRKTLCVIATDVAWPQYFDDFQYGLQRWVLKDEVVRPGTSIDALRKIITHTNKQATGQSPLSGWFLSDIQFVARYKLASPGLYKVPKPEVLRAAVLANEGVQRAGGAGPEGKARVEKMVKQLGELIYFVL